MSLNWYSGEGLLRDRSLILLLIDCLAGICPIAGSDRHMMGVWTPRGIRREDGSSVVSTIHFYITRLLVIAGEASEPGV